ncbi:hypothetical protein PG995_015557 [Apiospora arundinis]|uniref:GPI-anchored CFEM domain protein n=1 Tax=Apiospora arundinis TaxID=335852 RepID=A0ABR2IEX7_9PEZI
MKTSMMILGASAIVSAQNWPQGFPQCGTVCIPNMLKEAKNFNCGDSDWRCLCSQKNFIYGVRDCADQACPKGDDAVQVKQWGKSQCASVGVDIEGIGGSVTGSTPAATTTVTATGKSGDSESGSATASASKSAITTSDIMSTITSDGSTITTAVGKTTIFGGAPIPISTSAIMSTIVSDGKTLTSAVGSSIIFSTSGASNSGSANPSETQSGSASVTTNTSNVETTVTSNGSTFVTSTQVEQTSTSNPQAPSSTSNNPAAMKTAAPAAAFLAAAGFGMMML